MFVNHLPENGLWIPKRVAEIHDSLQTNTMQNLSKIRLQRVVTCSWVILYEHKLLH
jgi:hypothetical protein